MTTISALLSYRNQVSLRPTSRSRMTPDGIWSPHSPMLPIFQLVDVTVHPSLVCFQGSRLEQGRTPGLKRQGGQAEGLQQRLTSLPAAFTSRAPPPCSSVTLEGPST